VIPYYGALGVRFAFWHDMVYLSSPLLSRGSSVGGGEHSSIDMCGGVLSSDGSNKARKGGVTLAVGHAAARLLLLLAAAFCWKNYRKPEGTTADLLRQALVNACC
jgi:hypothetical protein